MTAREEFKKRRQRRRVKSIVTMIAYGVLVFILAVLFVFCD